MKDYPKYYKKNNCFWKFLNPYSSIVVEIYPSGSFVADSGGIIHPNMQKITAEEFSYAESLGFEGWNLLDLEF